MDLLSLTGTAQALVAAGKGILAADESSSTIKRRFDSIQLVSTEDNRRSYRDLLLTTAGMEQYISGVILVDETLRQKALHGTPFAELLAHKGVIPGIKVDTGAHDLAGFPGEKVTEGLDGLRARLAEYYRLGARFAKWRAVIGIGAGLPTRACILANAHALARYAALCQEAGLVPIVEPEVLMDGDHDIEQCFDVTAETQRLVFNELCEHRVVLEGTLLKPNMVLPGAQCPRQASHEQIAELTVRCLRASVPALVPGIVFLSGGQGPVEATERLNAMNRLGSAPWELSFSYGRALQDPSLKAWRGQASNVTEAQRLFALRARCNGAARTGQYTAAMETTL
jgi:fructose-bisphosphate aldolase, class I